MNYEAARAYALARLSRELSPVLIYHSLAHTLYDVLPAVERLASMEGLGGEGLLLLRTAALYHDFGFVERYPEHEVVSVSIAEEALPRFGYNQIQIKTIASIICSTRLPQTPLSKLEAIMADADLDVLGREDFLARNQALRHEQAAMGLKYDDGAWYAMQYAFLTNHQYFTAAARALRDTGKSLNRERLAGLLHATPHNSAAESGALSGEDTA